MVLIVIKASKEEEYLLDLPAATAITEVISVAVEVHNLWFRLNSLCKEVDKLLQRPADTSDAGPAISESTAAATLLKAYEDARRLIHKDQVARKVVLTPWQLRDAFGDVRTAVLDAFPGGLSEGSPLQKALVLPNDQGETQEGGENLDASTAELWFAGKQLTRGKLLQDHVGRNEKTKVVVKLQEAGMGRPLKEPAMDEATHKAMLAYHFKKQEQQKALEADDELFPTSAWANSKSLKKHFSGVDTVRLG